MAAAAGLGSCVTVRKWAAGGEGRCVVAIRRTETFSFGQNRLTNCGVEWQKNKRYEVLQRERPNYFLAKAFLLYT